MQNSARELTGNVKIAQASKARVIGGEIHMPAKLLKTPNAAEMTYELEAPEAGGDITFIIGDPTGVGAIKLGGAIRSPNTLNGTAGLVAPNKAMFATKGMVIGGINIETSTDKSQFNNPLMLYAVNGNGNLVDDTISFKGSKRANSFDQLVMSVNLEFVIDDTRFIAITVKDGQTVSLTLKPAYYL